MHGINEHSAGNYYHMVNESSGRIGFCGELPTHKRGIHPRKRIPPGITSLFTQIQAGKIKVHGKILQKVTIPGSAASKPIY
jgi:hypothetical protein